MACAPPHTREEREMRTATIGLATGERREVAELENCAAANWGGGAQFTQNVWTVPFLEDVCSSMLRLPQLWQILVRG